jgi:alanyl-tRNA synthetase
VDSGFDNFAHVFPEIEEHKESVASEIRAEEIAFSKTLDRGIALFDQAAERSAETNAISAADAFQLHDTFGFPIGLTQLMAEERGMTVDLEGFEREMETARKRSRKTEGEIDVKALLTEVVQQTNLKATTFTGYTETSTTTAIRHIYDLSGESAISVEQAGPSNHYAIVTDTSPFYAEAGGQVGDTGEITFGGGVFRVTDTQKIGDVHFHLGTIEDGVLDRDHEATLQVDTKRRDLIMNNHTTTHLMNRALRDRVNPDTMQKGSLVDDEKLRFDFSQNTALTHDELTAVEELVNADIAADLPVNYQTAPQEDALKINGLRAVFGEKYPPHVRVVAIGATVNELLADPSSDNWADLSIEFCGGTHLASTGPAKAFTITTEEGIAKGVRRITALTGDQAEQAIARGAELTKELEATGSIEDAGELGEAVKTMTTKINDAELPAATKSELRESLGGLQVKLKKLAKQANQAVEGDVVDAARALADAAEGDLIIGSIKGADANSLRKAMDVIKSKKPEAAMLLAAASDDKIAFLAAVSEGLIAKGLKAGDWVREVAKAAGGGGGGRPDMAQAGGKDPAKLDEALQTAQDFAAKTLG